MKTSKILMAGLAGGIAFFFLGFLIYGVLLMDFFAKNAGSATGLQKEPMVWWAMIVGNLLWGFLLALIFGRWAGIKTFKSGLMAGAVLGFLTSLSSGLMMFSTSNIANLTATLADPVASAVLSGLTGGVVAWVLGIQGSKVEKLARPE